MKIYLFPLVFFSSLFCSFVDIKQDSSTKVDHVWTTTCPNSFTCKRKLDEVFHWTINKHQVVIHSGQYCQQMCDLIFSKAYHVDANTKIDLIASLLFYQRRYIQTIVLYAGLTKTNDMNSSLLMLFAPLEECDDSLLTIQTNKGLLKKLDSTHLDFVLKTDSLIRNTRNADSLEVKYRQLLSSVFIQKWFFDKYKKYFLSFNDLYYPEVPLRSFRFPILRHSSR
jgi:hypothetical protein